jgi:biopolymer transport protein ExbD
VIDMALPSSAEAAQDPAERLELTVRVSPDAYVVVARGHAPNRIARVAEADSHAPDADTRARLSAALSEFVAAYPDQRDLKIVSGPATRYEEIVALMDVARDAGLPSTALAGEQEGAL